MLALIVVLVLYVSCIAFVRVRNRAHLNWGRQLTDFSTFMVPFNIPAYLLSRVPLSARPPLSSLPQLRVLQDNWQTIRDEALALYGQGHIAVKTCRAAASTRTIAGRASTSRSTTTSFRRPAPSHPRPWR